jgi:hypothetical protein
MPNKQRARPRGKLRSNKRRIILGILITAEAVWSEAT